MSCFLNNDEEVDLIKFIAKYQYLSVMIRNTFLVADHIIKSELLS